MKEFPHLHPVTTQPVKAINQFEARHLRFAQAVQDVLHDSIKYSQLELPEYQHDRLQKALDEFLQQGAHRG